jgi:hypothetical protein
MWHALAREREGGREGEREREREGVGPTDTQVNRSGNLIAKIIIII